MTREEKVQGILKVARKKKSNISTLVWVLAFATDKGLTKFYKEYVN